MVNLTFSKSEFMQALQQPLAGDFAPVAEQKDDTARNDPQNDQRVKAGIELGELAKTYFDDGIEVPNAFDDVQGCAEATQDLIDAGQTVIYEATAINPHDGTYCRIDILRRDPESDPDNPTWDMIEVKSATKVKSDYLDDLAFQRHVFENAGFNIGRSMVLHIDKNYVAGDDIDPQSLFQLDDVTARVQTRQKKTPSKINELLAHKTGKPVIEPDHLKTFLDGIEYPIHYLDYETVMHAIPLYPGTRPYQQVPFQFSLHVQDSPDIQPTHTSFLHTNQDDPRRAFAEKLIETCGDRGSVIVYYKKFEKGRNEELAKDFPDLADRLHAINDRMVDIYEPFEKRWLYDPRQNGSASLKVVLPTYTDLSYDDMGIGNGEQALQKYLAFVKGEMTDPDEISQLWQDLEEYCKQDTFAMVVLLRVIEEKAGFQRHFSPQDSHPQGAGIKTSEFVS